MKNRAGNVVLYAALAAAFPWVSWMREGGFFILPSACFLALAVWEGRMWARDRRADRNGKFGWSPTLDLAFVVLAVCQARRAVVEPDETSVFMAVFWSILGVFYAVRAVRFFGRRIRNKEEEA